MAEGTWVNTLQDKIGKGMQKGLDLATGRDVRSIKAFVETQRRLHPNLADDPPALAARMIVKRQWYGAAASFVWGLGGWWTLVPNLAHLWRIHGRLVLTIAHAYGYDLDDPERREEIALCVALSAASGAVTTLLRQAGMLGARKVLMTETSRAFIKTLPRQLVTIAGKKSLTNVAKVVPIASGVVGGVLDFFSTKGVGAAANAFYS